jgi:transcriptional regulator with XRE-family HTH domain
MNSIRILAETDAAVTISRNDWTALLEKIEDAEDRAAVAQWRAEESAIGKEAARQNYLTGDEARRLLDGENPVRLWREKRGLTQRAVAAAANISPSYLAEIEAGKKPGSADAIGKLAQVLGVPKEDLMTELLRIRAPEFGPAIVRWWPHRLGLSSDNRGALPEVRTFKTVSDAVDWIRKDWHRMSGYAAFIESADGKLIYDHSDLYQMIDPENYAILTMQAAR